MDDDKDIESDVVDPEEQKVLDMLQHCLANPNIHQYLYITYELPLYNRSRNVKLHYSIN